MTAIPAPDPGYEPTLPVFLRLQAERHGDRELLVQDDRRLGFAETEVRSAHLARALLAEGVGKGSRVGLWFPNGPEWVLGFAAAARIGAVVVPINTFYKSRELFWTLRHADVDTLWMPRRFLGNDYVERLEAAAPELARAAGPDLRLPTLPCLRRVRIFGGADRAWARDGDALEREGRDGPVGDAFLRAVEATVTPADEALILYSSGSTADPKGAVHTQGTVLRHSWNLAAHRDLKEGDRVWSPMPFFWVGGLVFSFLGNLQIGATTLCQEVFEPGSALAFLERERATLAIGWPHFGKLLAEHPDARTRDLSSLRGGNVPDLLPEALVPADPLLRGNALGMTETCGPHTWSEGRLPEALRGTFGRAVPGVEHRIVDPDTGRTLPPGEPGEICVRGYSLMQRLYKVPREETFDADGFYHTGDAGFFRDGILTFQGRLGEMIKSGGANVTPSEIEAVMNAWPEVKVAHVVGLPDEARGQVVVAAVVPEPGETLDPEALRQRVKGELSAYKVPRYVFVLTQEALPFTDSGKIDKRRLTTHLQTLHPGT